MRAGKLRHRVDVETPVETKNQLGEPVLTWKVHASRRASIEPLSGRELMQARQVEAETTHRVRLRWLEGLHPRMRIRFGSRLFGIESIQTPNEVHHEHELLCREEV